ncbi:MAG: HIT family protein [Bacilli bacterium]|nr:HIT family protein [Bacilli bacterium]
MNDCIFCKILKGELPSKVIYEDEILSVFMNIDPNTNGHLLMVPKNHEVTFDDVSEEFITHSLSVIRDVIYPLVKEKLGAEGLTISQNNYLGQEVKHFHIHLIPRYSDDGVLYTYNKRVIRPVDETYETLTKKD